MVASSLAIVAALVARSASFCARWRSSAEKSFLDHECRRGLPPTDRGEYPVRSAKRPIPDYRAKAHQHCQPTYESRVLTQYHCRQQLWFIDRHVRGIIVHSDRHPFDRTKECRIFER